MKAGQLIRYALVEFRPNPARPEEGRTQLGFVFEFATRDAWVVALALQSAFPIAELDRLDPLSRGIADNRMQIIKDKMDEAFSAAEHIVTCSQNWP